MTKTTNKLRARVTFSNGFTNSNSWKFAGSLDQAKALCASILAEVKANKHNTVRRVLVTEGKNEVAELVNSKWQCLVENCA